jgi:aminoglycoside phosphotransferase (APT) family kinase protein
MVDGVDLEALERWMDGQGLGEGPIADAITLAGGTQNILLRFSRSGRSYVLRRPPLVLRANSNETMRREARVLAALKGSNVPIPN